jgi:hypothetical protein
VFCSSPFKTYWLPTPLVNRTNVLFTIVPFFGFVLLSITKGSRIIAMGKPEGQHNKSQSWQAKKQQSGFSAPVKAPATPAAPPRKYVVVIRNVENDFARVHSSALERYFRLNRSLEKGRLAKTLAAAAKGGAAGATVVVPSNTDVSFEIKARTETRTAELRIYAPSPSSDISSAWTPSNNFTPSAAADGGESASGDAEGFSIGAGGLFSSLSDMVSVLKQKPYLAYPPTFMAGGSAEEGEEAAPADAAAAAPLAVAVRQSDFITVELITSAYTSNKNLKKVLADVPGFITSWPLYTMHFRGIFANESALFRSKSLLDQFEAEGLRINVVLPDVVARKYEAYLTHQADE